MKPLEILSALPEWAKASPDVIVDSSAFAVPCRLGDESVILRPASVEPARSEMLVLSIAFGDEPHELCLARSPSLPELDKIWACRSDMPDAILLALVEKECGPFFQLLENAVRKQLRLVGLAPAGDSSDGHVSRCLNLQVSNPSGILFSITRSATVVSALGVLRNLDLAHEAIRSLPLAAQVEYAAFAMSDADLASLAPADAVLVPEIASLPPRLVVAGRFLMDANGVAPHEEDALVRVCLAEARTVSLGGVFDAVEAPSQPPDAVQGAQLRLVRSGRDVATGRLDRIGDQNAFIVETVGRSNA